MTDQEYAELTRRAVAEMRAKQVEVAEIFASDEWQFDAGRGAINFLAEQQPFVDANVMCIGTWAFQSRSWRWAWANDSIPAPLRVGAERLKELAAITGQPLFEFTDAFVISEDQAWELSALSRHYLDALAVHSVPLGDRFLYCLIRTLVRHQPPDALAARAEVTVQRALRAGNGSALLNLMRARFPELRPQLVDADLRGAAQPWTHDLHTQLLVDHDLLHARQAHDLTRANFSELRLDGAILRGATLTEATFAGASLVEADLSGADLRGASFANAFLNGANFTRARMDGADFSGAELARTLFTDVDLSAAKGLDAVTHAGPSEISFSTLVASGFEVTPEFLHKAGVSRGLIEDLAHGQRFRAAYQTCFLSYSSKDADFAGALYRSLTEAGVRVFWDRFGVVPGDYLDVQIAQAIRELKRLIIVLSPSSMASDWVAREVELAWYHDRDSLMPIRLCPIDDVKRWTTERGLPDLGNLFPIQDFSTWTRDEDYARGVALVLKALSTGVTPSAVPTARA